MSQASWKDDDGIRPGPVPAAPAGSPVHRTRRSARRLDLWQILTLLAALAILVGAALVRLHDLNQYGLNSDEAVYAAQAAGLAGFTHYSALFGIFRAHPLLVQLIVSVVYRFTGVSGVGAREVCVGFGVALVLMTGLVALTLWGRLMGLIAMLFTAFSPYPVSVSRQMLLDGPEAFFVATTVLLLCLYIKRSRPIYLWSAALAAGLAFLSKETAILIVPPVLLFLILAPYVLKRYRDLVIAGAIYLVTVMAYPLAEVGSGKASTGLDYLVWQILRPPNHSLLFYAGIFGTMGWGITALAAVGTLAALYRRTSPEILLLSMSLVMVGLLEIWPTKGYEYLIPVTAPIMLLAASGARACGAVVWSGVGRLWHSAPAQRAVRVAVPTVVSLAAVAAFLPVFNQPASAATGIAALVGTDSGQPTPVKVRALAGSGGLAAGRPTALWARTHVLPGSVFLTIGPTFANILQFYSLHQALALSVSPNPLHRNPAYAPVTNADLLIRSGAVQYLVYDAYSADRSSHFAKRILALAKKFNGVLVYQYDKPGTPRSSQDAEVLIYQVQP